VTGDESWVHCYQPEMKRAGKEWYHSFSWENTKIFAHRLLCKK
jgi:hypothetical protein